MKIGNARMEISATPMKAGVKSLGPSVVMAADEQRQMHEQRAGADADARRQLLRHAGERRGAAHQSCRHVGIAERVDGAELQRAEEAAEQQHDEDDHHRRVGPPDRVDAEQAPR